MSTIPFEEEAVKRYLDGCILSWRGMRLTANSERQQVIASCYVDTYQSVRMSLFGERLPFPYQEGQDEL